MREFQYECGVCSHRWLARETGLAALLDALNQRCPACGVGHVIIVTEIPELRPQKRIHVAIAKAKRT